MRMSAIAAWPSRAFRYLRRSSSPRSSAGKSRFAYHCDLQGFVHIRAGDLIDDEPHLVRRLTGRALNGARHTLLLGGVTRRANSRSLAHLTAAWPLAGVEVEVGVDPDVGTPPAFLSVGLAAPVWPRNRRVGANSPSLCPTMFSVT